MLFLLVELPLKGLIAPSSMRTGFRLRRRMFDVRLRLGALRRLFTVRLTRRLTVLARRLVRDFLTNCPLLLRVILGLALLTRRFTFLRRGLATRVTLVAVAIGYWFLFLDSPLLSNSRIGS